MTDKPIINPQIPNIMKQILPIGLTGLPGGTHMQFHDQANSYIIEATAAALHVEAQAALYASLLKQEAAIINRPSSQRYTQLLADADTRRDNGLMVVLNLIKAHQRSIDDEKYRAAAQLASVIAPYNTAYSNSYMKETAEIKGLVASLRSAENAPLVALLGIEAEVDLLDEANTAFEEIHRLSQEDAQQRQTLEGIDTKELRGQVDACYQQIVLVVNAFAIASPSDELDAFIDSVNGPIYRTQQEASHSHSTSGSTADTGTDTPEPTPEPEPGGGEDEGEGGSPL